jgi:Histone methylation protein DOT1
MKVALQDLLAELEQDVSLYEPDQLRQRLDALDRIETCLFHLPRPQGDVEIAEESALRRRVASISENMEAANHQLYQEIRAEVRRGDGAKRLLEWAKFYDPAVHADYQLNGVGYDYLDALVSGVLQFDEPDGGIAELAPEMVFYQPTPARFIFDLIRCTALNEQDVLIDLGSGLGHVPLVANICTGARCIGVEIESVYADGARRSAQALDLNRVSFIQQDVRSADLSEGTVFYLYTPFKGGILRSVLDMLKHEAGKREIRICTLGPCTDAVLVESWLKVEGVQIVDQLTLFRSVQA